MSVGLLISLFAPVAAHATYYTATGRISWYDGEGKVGYDGKVLISRDCATHMKYDNPGGGTIIYVLDTLTQESGTFYKAMF